MKRIYAIVTSLFSLLLFSCGDILEDIQPYLDRGETIYVGKLDSVKVFPGKNRIKITGNMPYGFTQVKCNILWINPLGENDSKEFPIVRNVSNEPFEFIIDNLSEGQHDFTITTHDAIGNSSIQIEANGYSYGDIYQSILENRKIDNIVVQEISAESGNVWQATIKWLNLNNDEVQGCQVEYEQPDGNFKEIYVPIEETTTSFTDYKPNGSLRWNTVYLPDSLSIDKFYTEKIELPLPENQ
jgi:hypothetical protein